MNHEERQIMIWWDGLISRMNQGYITTDDELIDRNLYFNLQPQVEAIIAKYNPQGKKDHDLSREKTQTTAPDPS